MVLPLIVALALASSVIASQPPSDIVSDKDLRIPKSQSYKSTDPQMNLLMFHLERWGRHYLTPFIP